MKKQLTIEERIKNLEDASENPRTPGTMLDRILTTNGFEWSLGIGGMSMPKRFWIGKTIEDAVSAAEKDILL